MEIKTHKTEQYILDERQNFEAVIQTGMLNVIMFDSELEFSLEYFKTSITNTNTQVKPV